MAPRIFTWTALLLLLTASPLLLPASAEINDYFYPFSPSHMLRGHPPVIGGCTTYTVQQEDTLLDIARDFDLGFNELRSLHPALATWMPTPGRDISIPRAWITPLPPHEPHQREIVINLAEMRLFLFNFSRELIRSYPVGIGTSENPTPTGIFFIREKVEDPVWTVPPGLEDKYDISQIAAGEDNPLGRYWLGLGDSHYGIHGTNLAWSVGRSATHGCIRLYPEDISRIFHKLDSGTRVRIVYQPVKFGIKNGELMVEVHPDLYDRIDDLAMHAYRLLQEKELLSRADMKKLRNALQRKSGCPVSIAHDSPPNRADRVSFPATSPDFTSDRPESESLDAG
ncbi:MAG: L,D-transpeptidase family protein [Desulfohalobiaceae bacterium]|nr:L,D-transpeptidase family protein [Desulfohalobiaceae bacterium]